MQKYSVSSNTPTQSKNTHANISQQVEYWRTTRRLPLAVSTDGSVFVLILSVSRSKSHSRQYGRIKHRKRSVADFFRTGALGVQQYNMRECLGKEEEEEQREWGEKEDKRKKKEATWYLLFLPDTVTSVHLALWLHQSRRVQCSFPTVDRLVMV